MTRHRRKDRVLNTRIPEDLDRELREQAERLDVPVSQLVRGVLERTVNLLGNLSGNVEHLVNDVVLDVNDFKRIAEEGSGATNGLARELSAAVVGWQAIKVNRQTRCALTSEMLEPGADAHLGVREDGWPSVVVCEAALEILLAPPENRAVWSSLKLQRPMSCARTGVEMAAGDMAWFQPETRPPEFICDAEHERIVQPARKRGGKR